MVHARAVLNAEARQRSHTARARSVVASIITLSQGLDREEREMASVIVENAWSPPLVAKSNAWCCGVCADKSQDYIRQQIIKWKFRTK